MIVQPDNAVADPQQIVTDLQRRLDESIAQQAATAEVMQLINTSPGDLGPVFNAIVDKAMHFCDAGFGGLWVVDGDMARAGARRNLPEAYSEFLTRRPLPQAEAFGNHPKDRPFLHVADLAETKSYRRRIPVTVASVELGGIRTYLAVPLREGGALAGVISLYRKDVRPFTDRQIALVQGFAAQAEIAMKNARLFNETKEALEQQKASAEVLGVISSSVADTQPVFEKILDSIEHLFGGEERAIFLAGDDGLLHIGAMRGPNAEHARPLFPAPLEGTASEVAIRERRMVRTTDIFNDPDIPLAARERSRRFGKNYSMVAAPLLRGDRAIGTIMVMRTSMVAFTDRECDLLRTFANQAVIAIQNARLFNETREALERQTATADILQVIASSPSDVQPVFDAVAERAMSLLDCWSVIVTRFDGEHVHFGAARGALPDTEKFVRQRYPMRPNRETSLLGRSLLERTVVSSPDAQAEADPQLREYARMRGFHGELVVPLLRDDKVEGALVLTRAEPGPFTQREIALVQTFADQAVIAIQNVRMFTEVQARTRDLSEALDQQTATANVLKVISRSAFDLDTVLTTLLESACQLCAAANASLYLRDGALMRNRANANAPAEAEAFFRNNAIPPGRKTVVARVFLTGEVEHVADVIADPEYDFGSAPQLGNFRSVLGVPLLREGRVEGVFALARPEPGGFHSRQVELVRGFADQALIAIENVRLFDEVQARTRDLTESLEQQTATSEVLEVISASTGELEPVFQKMLGNATRVCGANFGVMSLYEGDSFRNVALYNVPPAFGNSPQTFRPHPESAMGMAARTRQAVQFEDVRTHAPYLEGYPTAIAIADLAGARTLVSVPMLRENELVGAIAIYRQEVRPFTGKQIELVANFAKQAVIAIENTRLLRELRARTDDLSESLQQQTATADVLKVISRSAFDLQAVFDTLITSAVELCGAFNGTICLRDGDRYRYLSTAGIQGDLREFLREHPPTPGRASAAGRVLLSGNVESIPDVLEDPDYKVPTSELNKTRSVLGVPLLRNDKVEGALMLARTDPGRFTERQIELVQTFADQAVIAIENVRLFDEVQARTKELAASLDQLRTAQDRLVQTEKLASLGQLTAGIAHEIKNPLNFVNNFSALSAELTDELNDALKSAVLDEKMREEVNELTRLLKDNLEKVVQHGKRADSIVKNMLLHSREGSGDHRPADINALVDESLNLAYHGARAEKPNFNVTLQRDFDPAAGMVEVFPQEITRAFLNLISNGFYATAKRKAEAGDGFEPVMRATTKSLGNKVEIRIRDNGTGIPPEVKEKMFNPFFTTKPAGEGTGLGLSMSHDIVVKQHGGTIDVATETGQFTEFTIVLPRTSNHSKKI